MDYLLVSVTLLAAAATFFALWLFVKPSIKELFTKAGGEELAFHALRLCSFIGFVVSVIAGTDGVTRGSISWESGRRIAGEFAKSPTTIDDWFATLAAILTRVGISMTVLVSVVFIFSFAGGVITRRFSVMEDRIANLVENNSRDAAAKK